jgi:hypothetical protein
MVLLAERVPMGPEVILALDELEMSAAGLEGRNTTVAVGATVTERETVRGGLVRGDYQMKKEEN